MEDKDTRDPEITSEPPAKKPKTDDHDCHEDRNPTDPQHPKPPMAMALLETDVGMTEYISSRKGFSGVIKQRFSDFLVNEISLDDQVVRLTSTSSIDEIEEPKVDQPTDGSELSEEWKQKLEKLLEDKDKSQQVCLEVGDDKEERTKIHKAIRQCYPGLESVTGEKDGTRCIIVKFSPGGSNDRRGRGTGPKPRSDYCHFTLYKENKDTMDAVNLMAQMLRMKPALFTYAGTKDRRAKTCQRVSAQRLTSSRLEKLNKGLRGMAVGDFKYCKVPLKLGDLKGNQFHIILRNVDGEESDIEAGLSSLKDVGFINYYGMQRFGTTSVPTHHIGRALLLSKWSEAIDLILRPRGSEKDYLSEAREVWALTKDPEAALEKMGRRGSIEQTLLTGLKKSGSNDYVGALGSLPRNTRMMYVHAYQSYVWNTAVSRRIKQFGLKVLDGDLVLTSNEKMTSGDKRTIIVSDEDKDKYTILDVVFPLPGWDVTYPQNVCGEWFTELLKEDDLSSDLLKHKVRDYSLPGDYRPLVVKPENMSWAFHQYEDVTKPLVLSDYEKLKGQTLQDSDGEYRALELKLTLPSSCYATMALREVLKSDTSAGHQSTLNK